jgi:2-polyprenyl-3-methyl-5-hydroxy-6-metoxy-1,4-benzoquinol methylase
MKNIIKHFIFKLLTFALQQSNRERGESQLKKELSTIVPDLSKQYTTFEVNMDNSYLVNKIRGQHAFQMSIALKAIELLNKHKDYINIVDIGDSSGTHLIYLSTLLSEKNIHNIQTLSVNLDPVAVKKIKDKGLNAILSKAEELHLQPDGIKADIFLSYEMLEHLFDPISFLHNMATKSECEYFVLTVPYVYQSRVGMHHLRENNDQEIFAENTHIFELSPEDWNLLFRFSGWEIVYRDKYTQYPKSFPLNLTKYIWRKVDFDGFYGVILKKNLTIANRYQDWC